MRVRTSTGKSTIIITVLALISAVMGFGRDAYIASRYGASGLTDEFYMASVVPDMVAQVIAYALTNAFIPVLKAELRKANRSAMRLISTVFWDATIFLLLMTVLTIWLRGPLIHLLAPGFSATESKQASGMLLIMSISVIFCGLSGVLSGIHNAREQFSYPALTGIVNNLFLIGTAVLLGPWIGIRALAYAFSIGFFGRFIIQFIPLLRGRHLRLSFCIWHRSLVKIIVSLGPIIICSGFEMINLIVDRILASQLPQGQITILSYASKLGMVPYSLIGTSLATTIYAKFVNHTLDGNQRALRRLSSLGTGWVVFWGWIVASGFIFYGNDLVSILFGHGDFTNQDVMSAALPLKFYGYFAVSYLLPPILSKFFFSRHENWLVTCASFIALCIDVACSILLVGPLGIRGLVLANALSQTGLIIILGIALVRRLKWKMEAYLMRAVSIGFGPGITFLCGAVLVKECWRSPSIQNHWTELLQGVFALVTGTLMVLGYARIFKRNQIGRVVAQIGGFAFKRSR